MQSISRDIMWALNVALNHCHKRRFLLEQLKKNIPALESLRQHRGKNYSEKIITKNVY